MKHRPVYSVRIQETDKGVLGIDYKKVDGTGDFYNIGKDLFFRLYSWDGFFPILWYIDCTSLSCLSIR